MRLHGLGPVASVDSECDGCRKKWVAKMKQGGQVLYLCSGHANELIHMRSSEHKANIWAHRLGTSAQNDQIPDDAIAISNESALAQLS